MKFLEEDRYIEEAIRAKKKHRTFIHQETGFTAFHQTIVIWCLKDFCRNKRFIYLFIFKIIS